MTPRDGETLLVRGARVLDSAENLDEPPVRDMLIRGGAIEAIGEALQPQGARVLDAAGMLAIPGFVNAHYHSHDIFLKGYFDPQPLEFWVLNALPRNYPPRSATEIRTRTLLGAAECIRSGITTVQDMVTLFPMTPEQVEAVHAAYAESGLRTVLALQVADTGPLDTVPYWRETIPAEFWPIARTRTSGYRARNFATRPTSST